MINMRKLRKLEKTDAMGIDKKGKKENCKNKKKMVEH